MLKFLKSVTKLQNYGLELLLHVAVVFYLLVQAGSNHLSIDADIAKLLRL